MAEPTPIKGTEGALTSASQTQLQALSKRIMALMEDRAAVDTDLKEVFNEAKDAGFDTKILRKAIKLLQRDPKERKAEEDMIDMYAHAVQPDLFSDTKAA